MKKTDWRPQPKTDRNVIWTPQPKQAAFMSRPEYEAFYGGAAGGGKSDALVIEALRQIDIPHYKGLILRKTYPQLSELIEKSLIYYKMAYPRARWNGSEHFWTFPSGAKIIFGSMQYQQDRTKYQGKAYDYIAFDELTHFTWDEYSYLFSRNRPNGPGTRVYIRGTGNPGGIGHGWVKERFITAAKPMTTMWDTITWREPDGREVKSWQSRIFVQSTVFDNKKLLDNDPGYIQRLASLPEAERNALLYGDWDSFSGQVFMEWRNDPDHYEDRHWTHVINPFYPIPDTWKITRSLDWGYSKPFSCHWYATDHDKRMYQIRELYGSTGQPNVGVMWPSEKVAQEIKRIEKEDPNLKGRRIGGIADPAIFTSSGSESVAVTMERNQLYFEPGNNDRINGKMQLHNRLMFDENGIPMLYIFSTCKNTIRTFPALVYSQTDVEDVDSDGEDHAYDETRYVCMANPIPARIKKTAPSKPYNPFDDDKPKYSNYDYFKRF